MAFKGLQDRFEAKAKTLYNHSARDDSGQPYVEYGPLTPGNTDTRHDTFTLPIYSTKRDLVRIGKFLKSGEGIRFLAKQELQQLGNQFSETRIINPLFAIGNVVPFLHISHTLVGTNDFAVRNADDTVSPASNDTKIGGAGRMQRSTAADAVKNVAGNGGLTGLLSLLPPTKLVGAIIGAISLTDLGSTGMDERPELTINNSYYSIALWQHFQKQRSPQDYFSSAKKNLRVGNFVGAYDALKGAVNSVINTIRGVTGEITGNTSIAAPLGRDNPDTKGIEGSRYFITDKNNADRYIRNSIGADGEAEVGFLDRRPYRINGSGGDLFNGLTPTADTTATPKSNSFLGGAFAPFNAAQQAIETATVNAQQAQRAAERKASDFERQARTIAGTVQNVIQNPSIFSILNAAKTAGQIGATGTFDVSSGNPASDSAMLFPATSLKSRYESAGASDVIRSELDIQKQTSFAYWKKVLPFSNIGFKGGILPGVEHNIDPQARTNSGTYYTDKFNKTGVISVPGAGKSGITPDALQKIKSVTGNDLINVMFLDDVNKFAVPFRAFITGLGESVVPEWSERTYIGRTERNVVYVRAVRDISFQLRVQAFSSTELQAVWDKVNAMTGLCFPSDYADGFMIPPLVRLTIGDIYRNQAGFIKSLSHTIDDDAGWEITEGKQAPHSVLMNISFSIIEDKRRSSKFSTSTARFYTLNAPSN